MTRKQIIQAWRDGEFLDGLDDQQRGRIPESPVGLPTLSDDDLLVASGGAQSRRSKGFLSIGRYCTSTCSCPHRPRPNPY